ncbi:hypothetical protein DPQ33_17655 [Oceanidesulfovibrio indonesiensis]|uniref:Uncharacterized protein n=1 Tax=Oceanidesulfovibrio indonesiensis TaxID=54767 RepID=A0A7M3MAN7_9BACT|nr:hypothetical protein DPQ33_17655 [Oceanidesulfovibrio indonesiensis]
MNRREKLTKKLLFTLETGLIIASNVYDKSPSGKCESRFVSIVPDHSDRLSLWEKLKSQGLNGRTFAIFKSTEEYEQYCKENQAIIAKSQS